MCVLVVFGCEKAVAPPPEPAPEAARPAPEAAMLVGVVHAAGTRVCREGQPEAWLDPHMEIGFTRLVSGAPIAAGSLPTIAHGQVLASAPAAPVAAPADAVPCPQAQMRSDWVESPDGFRVRRGDGPGIAAFEVARTEPFEGLRVALAGDELELRLVNTLPRALAGPVTVSVHYEGCYGKPGTTTRTLVAEAGLEPGAELSGRLPSHAREERVRGRGHDETAIHAADSVSIEARGDDIHFDFDVQLDALGAAVTCPRDSATP